MTSPSFALHGLHGATMTRSCWGKLEGSAEPSASKLLYTSRPSYLYKSIISLFLVSLLGIANVMGTCSTRIMLPPALKRSSQSAQLEQIEFPRSRTLFESLSLSRVWLATTMDGSTTGPRQEKLSQARLKPANRLARIFRCQTKIKEDEPTGHPLFVRSLGAGLPLPLPLQADKD